MTVFIDLIGSWFVRASMIAVMLGLTVTLNDALYQSTQQVSAKGYIATIDSILYADINDAGYNVDNAATSTFQTVDSTSIQFLGDINGGGVPETVRYTVTQQSDGTFNLYRYVNNVNNGADLMMGNLASIRFSYYDSHGLLTTDKTKVRQVEVSVVANGASSDFKIYPANLL
jgi:hypothetical protein